MKKAQQKQDHPQLREAIRSLLKTIIKEESDDPGGALTKLGALFKLDPSAAKAKVVSTLRSSDGKVDDAARKLGIAPRTLYWRAEENPDIEKAIDVGQEESERDDVAAQRKRKQREKDREEKEDEKK